jgi:pimeloyl-ACP methyl ester carboxylesterase
MAEAMSGAGQLRLLQRCSAELQKLPHGDLRFYTTTVAMQDFDAVRQQLGVQRWNLIGASYGTRAALEYHRQFPQAVRRTLLDGMAPPDQTLPDSMSADAQAALDRVFSACEENARCTQAYPQLRTRWQQLLQSLPREVKLPHPLSGAPEGVMLEREALLRAVRLPLYTPAMTAALPAALHAATQSRFEGLAGLASGMGMSGKDRLFDGMHFSVICAEDGPRLAAEGQSASGRDFGDADARLYRQVCAQWPRGEVPAAFYKISAAQSPVLLLSGGADPVTPPRHGQRVAEALGTKALHLVAPNAGHGVMRTTCLREPLLRFFNAASDDEALALKADCLERMPRALPFIPPGTPKPAASEVSK